jgi:hypothetical protein
MTQSDFNNLERGDVLCVSGRPVAVVDAAYFKGTPGQEKFAVDATSLLSGDRGEGMTFGETDFSNLISVIPRHAAGPVLRKAAAAFVGREILKSLIAQQ